ncbi:sugar phosphate nucleotidyltransferase [Paenibacillus agricola]|uniref:Mannose-1-phosphate guanylyltransferase n=1 Tax=Paenibacillus agricola TaxID=2716264 RepID=A0ABX0J995_9BACL|nr:sugar phosphate nucleotidyltransferase [Paenibacillus agricola]NHN32939.1 mannose-1-phosphate guanylyltransferase [Paenibacillus agricola]
MNIVLLSGGSGLRLWPLSNEQRSKQFVPFFKDENGHPASMLQNVWSQLSERGLHKSAVIATAVGQQELIREQLGRGIDLVLEPAKRDTFPAILLSVAYLYSHRGVSRDEPVAIMPVDSQVGGSFYDSLLKLPQALESTGANIALMGVKPTFPSEKYGYIVPKAISEVSSVASIEMFYEKPSAKEAAQYIERGALWNCGVFCFKVGYVLDLLAKMGLPNTYEELLLAYSHLESDSFDRVVTEKEERIAAIVYDGTWKDLGTWCTLTEELDDPVSGKGFIGKGNKNVHIMNELDIPIVAIGLSDIIIAANNEGILISNKEASVHLKDALLQMKEKSLLKEDSLALIDHTEPQVRTIDRSVFADGTIVTTRRIQLKAGMEKSFIPLEDGRKQIVSWTIIHGNSRLVKKKETKFASAGWNIVLEDSDHATLQALDTVDLMEIITVTGDPVFVNTNEHIDGYLAG